MENNDLLYVLFHQLKNISQDLKNLNSPPVFSKEWFWGDSGIQVLVVVFSCLTLFFLLRQTAILKIQSEIQNKQTELQEKQQKFERSVYRIEKINQLHSMMDEYIRSVKDIILHHRNREQIKQLLQDHQKKNNALIQMFLNFQLFDRAEEYKELYINFISCLRDLNSTFERHLVSDGSGIPIEIEENIRSSLRKLEGILITCTSAALNKEFNN